MRITDTPKVFIIKCYSIGDTSGTWFQYPVQAAEGTEAAVIELAGIASKRRRTLPGFRSSCVMRCDDTPNAIWVSDDQGAVHRFELGFAPVKVVG